MRTPRVFILLTFVLASFTLLALSLRSSKPAEHTENQAKSDSSAALSTFSFNTPLSLFPPNAIISLTDDNTTSFLARPAAFGPPLPPTGLSGQLWVGSGFGDDSLRHGIISTSGEGELGCSDVMPEGNNIASRPLDDLLTSTTPHNRHRRDAAGGAATDDGTDDNRYNEVSDATPKRRMVSGWPLKSSTNSGASHADIQSIQESAEIAGKVVMLSRGGCGFLEKVEWAQRRGGIAVIVADDTRGGPLIQMYARGDTSNVTIPSVFTSHTTAHLLSSLIPPGTYIEDAANEDGYSMLKVKRSKQSKRKGKKGSKQHKSRKGSPAAVPKGYTVSSTKSAEPATAQSRRDSWLGRLIWGSKPNQPVKKDVLDWIVVDEWDDNKLPVAGTKAGTNDKIASKAAPKDDPMIGVHDWRDPDFIKNAGTDSSKLREGSQETSGKVKNKSPIERLYTPSTNGKEKVSNPDANGGSIITGGAEYGKGVTSPGMGAENPSTDKTGLFPKVFADDNEDDINEAGLGSEDDDDESEYDNGHEGLWVTLTQTSGATPFFDTLLVLVVSPLVTLTVVYTLLLVRSRIRQRRWRAPKSVVERLPVRTYRTIPATSSDQSRQPSPSSSSPTTPLLQQSPSRPRPRSRTTSGLPEPTTVSRTDSSDLEAPKPRRANEHEKKGDWKKYMGRQVECVVCLEEYVDGVSRVMSLPCGHEFHVDCITPWLTTRRRTCPICKGDVVRSLARGGSSSSIPRYEPYRDDSDDEDDDLQSQVANTMNESPAAGRPISPGATGLPAADADVERGVVSQIASPTRSPSTTGSWLSNIAARLGISSPPTTEEDRTSADKPPPTHKHKGLTLASHIRHASRLFAGQAPRAGCLAAMAKLGDMISTIRWRNVVLVIVVLTALHFVFIDDTLRNSYSSYGVPAKDNGGVTDPTKVPEGNAPVDGGKAAPPKLEEPSAPVVAGDSKPADPEPSTAKPADAKQSGGDFYADAGAAAAAAANADKESPVEPTAPAAPQTTFTPAPFDSGDTEEYLAICVSVKDQYLDLLEWLTHHYHHHNIRRFYLMDDGSTPVLATLNFSSAVDPKAITHRYYHPATRLVKHQQLVAYDECIALFGHKHKWMAFLDADEFLEVRGKDTLHGMLKELDGDDKIGALAVNWQIHTSSGLLKRPDSSRKSFVTCIENYDNPGHDPGFGKENEHIKTIVKTKSYEKPLNPHKFALKDGARTVGENGDNVDRFAWRVPITRDRISLHHFASKSREQFEAKISRGNGMGDPKGWEWWNHTESLPDYKCEEMTKYDP
ncbi:hypothetical protein V494_06332 [Pseudogymnoascus sp. VKM F-4513 (FW-928)]|nr:hypothetical protein V494_06332 [Pseudogymnoascus sp. VKM F-4513 (FW-928)]